MKKKQGKILSYKTTFNLVKNSKKTEKLAKEIKNLLNSIVLEK